MLKMVPCSFDSETNKIEIAIKNIQTFSLILNKRES